MSRDRRRLLGRAKIGAAVLATLGAAVGVTAALRTVDERRCADVPGAPTPANTAGLAKIQPNPDRPAVALPVDDHTAGRDDIVFETNPREPVGARRDVTAVVLAFPRSEARRLDAQVTARAGPGPTADRVTLEVCVGRKGHFTAGTYEGTVLLYGPRVNEFAYPFAITSKWPWWVAAGLLLLVIVTYVGMSWRSDSPPGPTRAGGRTDAVGNVIYAVVALFAAGLTYWSVYVKNATWGEDPAVQIPALVVGALTSVVAAQSGAKEWMKRRPGDDEPGKPAK
jgi:hypothetical protein